MNDIITKYLVIDISGRYCPLDVSSLILTLFTYCMSYKVYHIIINFSLLLIHVQCNFNKSQTNITKMIAVIIFVDISWK